MHFSRTIRALAGAFALAFAGLAQAIGYSAVSGMADYASVVELDCNFEYRSGREFQFPTADPVLHPYGFVLWKSKPSILSAPLDYSLYQGRRGKLTGDTLVRDGITWFAGVLDDCSRIYAEDASAHSEHTGLEHLMFHGKVYFIETFTAAKNLIGHDVIVRGEGLEPRQRLYTETREQYYPLSNAQILRVVGIDTHRYAHAKGVGPFFLRVENDQGEQGLIKYNPEYLAVPHGALPVYARPPARAFARIHLPARERYVAYHTEGNQPLPGGDSYLLRLNRFRDEADAVKAVAELNQAGFAAVLTPLIASPDQMTFELRVEGFSSPEMARSMARIMASRFGWIKPSTVKPGLAVTSRGVGS